MKQQMVHEMKQDNPDFMDLNGYCSNCLVVPMQYKYDYVTKEQCKCSCHKSLKSKGKI